MDRVVAPGRLLFAVAIAAFGAEHLIRAQLGVDGVHAGIPVIPWIPANPILAYLTGVALLAAGVSLAAGVKPRLAAAFTGAFFYACVVLLQVSRLAADPSNGGVRTRAFETLAIGAAAWTLAGTLPGQVGTHSRWDGAFEALVKSGRYLFAVSLIVFGADHFLALTLVAGLVPPWIPGHMFWAVFTGASFIVAGVAIATGWMGRWGGTLIGTMFLLWFVLLHAPRVLGLSGVAGASHNPNEWSSAFIALAMAGGSWITARALAAEPRKEPRPGVGLPFAWHGLAPRRTRDA
jgi:uncharacterized membrane protein YphA (DoxX/SURF4 family)